MLAMSENHPARNCRSFFGKFAAVIGSFIAAPFASKAISKPVVWTHHALSKHETGMIYQYDGTIYRYDSKGHHVVWRGPRNSSETVEFEKAMQHWQGKVSDLIRLEI